MAFRIRFPIRCQALWIVLLGIATPCDSVVTISRSSGGASRSTGSGIPVTTVMRRMLASKISVEGSGETFFWFDISRRGVGSEPMVSVYYCKQRENSYFLGVTDETAWSADIAPMA